MARKSKFAPPTRHAELGEYSGVVVSFTEATHFCFCEGFRTRAIATAREGPGGRRPKASREGTRERDASLVERDQAAVGDGDTVSVARQIGEHGLWAGEWTLGIDEPARLSERGEERRKRLGVCQMCIGAEELQLARRVCRRKLREHQPAE